MHNRHVLITLVAASWGCGASTAPGEPDASVSPPTAVIIDFGSTSAAFPPTVNKIGFNSFWNAARNDGDLDTWVMQRSAAHRAPMISGLIEPKSLVDVLGYQDTYEEYAGKLSAAELDVDHSTLWDRAGGTTSTMFHRTATGVEARVPADADLTALRATANAAGLVNFLQVAGTPGTTLPGARYPTTDTFDNGLFTLVGTPTTGGNWYPLPAVADFPELAHAFATLPGALGPDTRTIYAFWQEPSHTISESLNAQTSIDRYAKLYAQLANQLAVQCPLGTCSLAGAQLNGNDGDSPVKDGYRYGMFMDALRSQRLANPGMAMPLDYFAIQNYGAQWNDNVVENSRVALGTDSNWTPVLMNEWDYCVNPRDGDGCGPELSHFGDRYESSLAWNTLHWLEDTIDRPDVSHVLLRDKVLRDRGPGAGMSSYPWSQIPILFMGAMSEFRRPASEAIPGVPMIASGDHDQITIIAWNEGATPAVLPLSLVNLPLTLVGKSLYVKRISKAIRDVRCPGDADVMNANHEVTCWEDVVPPISLAAPATPTGDLPIGVGEVVMIFAGAPPAYTSSVFATSFVRQAQHLHRDGSTAAPKEMAHFDPRTGSITVGVQAGGHGAGRILLEHTPDSMAISTRATGLGALHPEQVVAGIRVDYLDASGAPTRSVLFRDSRWLTSEVPWAGFEWPVAANHQELSTVLCGADCDDGDGGVVTLDLVGHAPAGWASTRRVELGVVVAGANGDAIYRVDLP